MNRVSKLLALWLTVAGAVFAQTPGPISSPTRGFNVTRPLCPPLVPSAVTKFRAKYGKLPLNVVRRWRASVWSEDGIREDRFGAGQWVVKTHLLNFPWYEETWVDGKNCREIDSNGLTSFTQGNDEKSLRTRFRIESGQWMLDESALSHLPEDLDGNCRVLYQPTDGVQASLSFDKAGDLSSAAFGSQEIRFSKYDQVGGIWQPKQLIVSSHALVNPDIFQLESSEINVSRVSELPTQTAGFSWLDRPLEQPLSLIQERWTELQVRLAGKPYRFVLDSGASETVIDIGLAKTMGYPMAGQQKISAGIFSEICLVRAGKMSLGPATLPQRTILGLDLQTPEFAKAMPGVRGILGRDIFATSVVVLDYPRSRIAFLPRQTFKPRPDDRPIQARREGPGLALKIDVSGRQGFFTLDTGSGGGVLLQHLPAQEDLVTAEGRKKRDPNGANFGSGSGATWPGVADVTIGPFVMLKSAVEVVDESTAKGASLEANGNVGVGFLRDFRVTIDLSGNRVWLARAKKVTTQHVK